MNPKNITATMRPSMQRSPRRRLRNNKKRPPARPGAFTGQLRLDVGTTLDDVFGFCRRIRQLDGKGYFALAAQHSKFYRLILILPLGGKFFAQVSDRADALAIE